jgi:hypothetical protein
VRLSHHAKNNLRLYGGTAAEVESVVKSRLKKGLDRRGNPMYLGFVGRRPLVVVVAGDDPNFVIAVFPKERG